MTLSGIGELPLFKRRSSAEELEALLDLIPNPTIIIDGQNGRILFANALATQLTAYTRRELSEFEIKSILPEFLLDSFEKKIETVTAQTLITRSSRSFKVRPKLDNLGGPDHWVAVSLLSADTSNENLETISKLRWEAVHMLSLAVQQYDLASAYRQILQGASLLTGAAHLALYLQSNNGNDLELEALAGSGFEFPSELALADVAHIRVPKIWQSGKPIESSLYKIANIQKQKYIATTPLDVTDPNAGLLVAADAENQAPKDLLTLLQIVATTVQTIRLKEGLVDYLQTNINNLGSAEADRAAILEFAQDGLVFADADLRVIDLNPAAETMLGYNVIEIKGKPANDVLICHQPLLPSLEKALEDGIAQDLGERKIHRRDGSEFLASLRIVPVSHENKTSKLAIFFTDLSEHEAFHLQNQQLQQRAAIGEITAIFAHEVRNPINSISTGLQLMQFNLPKEDPLQEQIKKLQEDVDRLEHRMKSVDAFSQNLEPHPEALDLGEFCRTQLDRWRARISRKHISDHIQVATDTPLILGDRRALDQVLTNLITNAVQAMEDQGEGVLALRVRPNPDDPDMVDLQISDSGPGIPEEIRKRIFEPFFTTKGQDGTGLGLAITRRIIMAHKGKIECESFPGGTLFKIQLPAAPQNAEGNPE